MSMKQTMCEFVHGMTCEEMSRFVGSIVRCRDCKHLIAHGAGCARGDYCDIESIDGFCAWGEDCVWFCAGNEQYAAVGWCRNFGCEVEPDGFCALGERRGE